MNKLGDICLLIGFGLIFLTIGSFDYYVVFSLSSFDNDYGINSFGANWTYFMEMCEYLGFTLTICKIINN
jgi:hypothetical protein